MKLTPERQAILDRVDERLRELHKDWAHIRKELNLIAQNTNNWHNRGIPANKLPDVARVLGWTVEQLLGEESNGESSWPFPNVPAYRIERLSPPQRMHVEAALMEELERVEEGRREKHRPAATEPATQQQSPKPARNRRTAP